MYKQRLKKLTRSMSNDNKDKETLRVENREDRNKQNRHDDATK